MCRERQSSGKFLKCGFIKTNRKEQYEIDVFKKTSVKLTKVAFM